MTTIVDIDYETRSACDLTKSGTHLYVQHPSTAAWCMAWRLDDEPEDVMHLWTPGDPVPDFVWQAAEGEDVEIWGHNVQFERLCTQHLMTRKYGWPHVPSEVFRCTMVRAYSNGLPGKLEETAPAAGISRKKDMDGHRNMKRMAVPKTRTPCPHCAGVGCDACEGCGEIYTWWDDPERLQKQYDYCGQDVWVQRDVRKRTRPLQSAEHDIWLLDQRINDRGVKMDVDLATAAQRIVTAAKAAMREDAVARFGVSPSAPAQIVKYLQEHGVTAQRLRKKDLEDFLDGDDLPDDCREILEIRRRYGQASVTKIAALFASRMHDDRIRGLLQYWAAFTGRWAGRRFQPQNLKRPLIEDVATAIECIAMGDHELVGMFYDDILSVVGDCIRGMLVSEDKHDLIAGDFPNIEGRVLSWLAGEQWKLDLFDMLDKAADPNDDMYIRSFCATFGVPPFSKKHPWRQIGKIMELASGYQGGHGAYISFGATGKKLRQIADTAKEAATVEEWAEAEKAFGQRGVKRFGMTRHDWSGLRVVIRKWRDKHEATTRFWRELEAGAIEAVENPGTWVKVGKIGWRMVGSALYMQLPVTKRLLPYQRPRVLVRDAAWPEKEPSWHTCGEDDTEESLRDELGDRFVSMASSGKKYLAYAWAKKKTLTHFSTINSSNRPKRVWLPEEKHLETSSWGRIATYGGMLAENATQAVARDILAYSMKRLEDAGYPLVLTVHDEAVAEVPEGFGSVEEFCQIMGDIDPGYRGLVIGTPDVWRGKRYRK